MSVQEVPSKRSKPIFLVNSYLYEVEKRADENNRLYCRCVQKREYGCQARCIIVKGPEPILERQTKDYSHGLASTDFIRRTAQVKMKKAVVNHPERGLKEVYSDTLVSVVQEMQSSHDDEELGVSIPTYDVARSSLYRARFQIRPALPQSRGEIVLEGIWTRTLGDANFLLFDDGTDERILGFSTDEMMGALCDARIIYMDGTFRVVPHLFTQLYSIHAFYKGQMIPLVYFLLPDKSKETYCRMFALLKSYATTMGKFLRPSTLQIDFEVAVLKAIEQEFPAAEAKGCTFHFSQCLWRKAQGVGLSAHYDDAGVKRFIRSCMAPALVPLNRIDDAWLEIDGESPAPGHAAYQQLEDFKQYSISTSSVFPRCLWNHHRNLGAPTTNHLGGWHQGLNRAINKSHVNLFEMITQLKKQEAKYKVNMMLLRMGQNPPRLSKKYKELNDRLIVFVDEFESSRSTLIHYVHNVAFNLHF